MDRNTKIVVVGAGSAEFGLDSLAGILRTEGLHGSKEEYRQALDVAIHKSEYQAIKPMFIRE